MFVISFPCFFSLPLACLYVFVIETHQNQKDLRVDGLNLLFEAHTTRWFALSLLLLANNPLVFIRRGTDFFAGVEPSYCLCKFEADEAKRRIHLLLSYDL